MYKELAKQSNYDYLFLFQSMVPTGFTVEPFLPSHLEQLELREEQHDLLALLKSKKTSLREFGHVIRMNSKHHMTVKYYGEIVLCVSVSPIWEGVADGSLYFSKNVHKQFKGNLRQFLKLCKLFISHMPYKRIQTIVLSTFPEAVKFVEVLGFKNEGIMTQYGPQGSDYYRYAVIQ